MTGHGRSDASASSGLRPFGAEPQEASQAKPLVPNAGLWAICKSYRVPEVRQIAKVTPTLVKFDGLRWPRQKPKSDIIACLSDEQAALLLAQSLAGAAGQREKRIMKARADFDERKAGAWAEYERTESRLVAIAMEARQGRNRETGSDPKDDSAGPKDIAQ